MFARRNISIEMVKAGWAEVYEQSGAEYGKLGKDEYLKAQKEAQCATSLFSYESFLL